MLVSKLNPISLLFRLFKKIKNAPATIMQQRIRIGDTKKMSLLCVAYLKFQIT